MLPTVYGSGSHLEVLQCTNLQLGVWIYGCLVQSFHIAELS